MTNNSHIQKAAAYASGTTNAMKGLALVGEKGPELVKFGGGEQVKNAHDTANILNGNQKLNSASKGNTTISSNPVFQISINESKNPTATAAEVEKVLEQKFSKYLDKQFGTIAVQMGFTEL